MNTLTTIVLTVAAVLTATGIIWHKGIKPVLEVMSAKVVDIAETSPRFDAIELWQTKTDDRLGTFDLRLDEINNAVNHRPPDGRTLSQEAARTAETQERIEAKLDRLLNG